MLPPARALLGLCLCLLVLGTAARGQGELYKLRGIEKHGRFKKAKAYAYDGRYNLLLFPEEGQQSWTIRGKTWGEIAIQGTGKDLSLSCQMGQLYVEVVPTRGQAPARFGWWLVSAGDTSLVEHLQQKGQLHTMGVFRPFGMASHPEHPQEKILTFEPALNLQQPKPGKWAVSIEPLPGPQTYQAAEQLAAALLMLLRMHAQAKITHD